MNIVLIETIIVLMFFTGILQWDSLHLPWEYFSVIQATHVILSVVVSLLLIIPFVNMHVYKYRKTIVGRKKNVHNGMALGITLLFIMLSGFYLFLVGNTGGDIIGEYAFYVHLYASLLLLFLLWYHSMFSNAKNRAQVKSTKKKKKKAKKLKKSALIILALFLMGTISQPLYAQQSSSSLYLSQNTKYIFTANLDGGSVSQIDAKTGQKLDEKVLGKDLRRIAFREDENVFGVTDYGANKVLFVNRYNNIVKTIKTKAKPHGIIHDKSNKRFIVSVYEAGELLFLDDKKFKLIKRIKTDKTPRGLALSSDGRLFVTHAMLGSISLYDAQSFKKLKTIVLEETQNDDEFVSQGKPRLLDDIEINPSGTQAWLPHVLWNFDHEFQFQSTVFPAVSVLSLEKGKERELVKKRKHLFKSINVRSNNNKTMIVSNPWDVAFSHSGTKAFVTLAGSEDVMVFNIGRSAGKSIKKRHRKRGKRSGKGAKVTQILRDYPNYTNPQSILVHPYNENIYVQNAARLDMTLLKSGGEHPFARTLVEKNSFSVLVKKDPLNPSVRLGKSLFNNANTNTYPKNPMSGDFWMSCNSCHFEGFNFTNGFLFKDAKRNLKNNAMIGHSNMQNGFVSKTPLQDYVKMSQDTQGGMGADTNASLELVKPTAMNNEVKHMMTALHEYVTAPENLRFLSTWIKLEEDVQAYHVEDWTNSAKCKSCHEDIFNQWADSNHKNLVGTNPYYLVLEDLAAKVEGESFRQWCMGCHNPSAVTTKLLSKTTPTMDKLFEKGASSLVQELKTHGNKKLEEGVSCVACHRITKVEDAGGNASYTLGVQNRKKYAFEDSPFELTQWLSQKFINSKPKGHVQSYMKPVYKKGEYCASCHDEFTPGSGSKIVSTFKEWQQSKYNNPNNKAEHKTCIDCHMTYLDKGKFSPLSGTSTLGGKIKKDIKVHYFAGANHFLSGLKNKTHEDQTLQLLRTSAKLDMNLSNNTLSVGVTNVGAGHHLPTGVADFRQLWLDITIKDDQGKLLFSSGKLNAEDELSKDARLFMKEFGDKEGKPVGLLFWKYEKLLKDTRIPAGQRRVEQFGLPQNIKAGTSLYVSVKLNFRIYPAWVTKAVQKTYSNLPTPPVIELQSIEKVLINP